MHTQDGWVEYDAHMKIIIKERDNMHKVSIGVYEFNVSMNGIHLFATAKRSCTTKLEMQRVADVLLNKFPKKEGYEIEITRWDTVGTPINIKRVN